MGRYWNVGLSNRDQLGATDHQLRYLRSIYKRDFRGDGLTIREASEKIDEGLAMLQREREGLPDIADKLFTHFMKRAVDAANEAGDRWLAEHPEPLFVVSTAEGLIGVHGPIGEAHVTAPKKGSGLAKWMASHGLDDRRNTKTLGLQHRHVGRLEGELQLKCCIAALEVLMEASTDIGGIRVVYRCDDDDFRLAA